MAKSRISEHHTHQQTSPTTFQTLLAVTAVYGRVVKLRSTVALFKLCCPCSMWSVMQSEGKQESVKEMEINGVRVSVVDRFDLASDADDPTVAGSYTLHSEITPEDTAGRSATQAGALRAAESAGAIVGQGLPENEDEDEEDGWLQDVEVLEGLSSPVAAGP
ncbi:hypothetical protein HaLaN_25429 [Haematococcus lacustris]|uniref:Uncharacterized protein n=1 Tax=Haematococcus lacustris TaxID=44745 RepID=A0A699ZYL3_HAELA|nr:hypothetical protein HaLaN_25429 [Haematococcus lacustris]